MDLRQSHVKTVGIDCQEGFPVCFGGLPGNNILLAAPLWRIFGSVLSIIVTSVVKICPEVANVRDRSSVRLVEILLYIYFIVRISLNRVLPVPI